MSGHKIFRYVFFLLFIFGVLFFLFREDIYSCIKRPVIPLKSNPRDIAINPVTDIAVITNKKDRSVSIVDLKAETVLSTIPIGKAPMGVAVDGELNIAVIGNSRDDTVSIIDLDSYKVISTIPVGNKPEGIAVNTLNHTGLVVNSKDDYLSVIDLIGLNVIHAIPTEKKPKHVSIDPLLNVAAVVNKKGHIVSLIDLNTYEETSRISVGKSPKAIDINPEIHTAAVVNKRDKSITIINLLTSESYTIQIREHPDDIALNTLDNRALVICAQGRKLLLIDLDTRTVIKKYDLQKHSRGIAVNNFTNKAAIVNKKTDSIILIQLPNPVPEITSIVPGNANRGSGELLIDIEGGRFMSSSTAFWGDKPLTTLFKNNKKIQALIPMEMLSDAGTFPVTVSNPQPEGGTSESSNFEVANPVPFITALDPAEALAGTGNLIINIYGTGFFNDSEVFLNGIKKINKYVNNTNIKLQLTSEELKSPGRHEIMIYNSSPGGGISNKVILTIRSPLEITITSPSGGETIDKSKVIVKGTVKAATNDIGITVNGIVANTVGDEWIADNIPLITGENTIKATVTDYYGNTDTKSIIIYANDIVQQIELSANITSGIAPLTTYFSELTSFVPASFKMDFEGDGIVDYTGTAFEDINYTYSSEGIFYPTLMVTDDQGNTYSDKIAVTVMNKEEVDNLLQNKWRRMTDCLVEQDIEGSLDYYLEESQQLYRDIYTAFLDQLPQVAQEMQDIQLIYAESNTAKYRLREEEMYGGTMETITYYIYFVLDKEGLWKIYRY